MDINVAEVIHRFAVSVIPLLFGITIHEAAHAYAAKLMGDRTAEAQGRISLNPKVHIDPIGTLLIPGICLLMPMAGGLLFGWAKPVPINPSRMRFPKKSPFWVALAGPASNLAMAVVWALLTLAASRELFGSWASPALIEVGMAGIQINLILMIFNLIPIPPLDGGSMLECWLKGPALRTFDKIRPHGFIIVMVLSLIGVLHNFWISPLMGVFSWVYAIALLGG